MNPRTISAVVACILHLSLFSQVKEQMASIDVDSLRQVLPGLQGKEEIDALNHLAFALSGDEPDSSILIAGNTRTLSEALEYKKGLADAYFVLGNAYFHMDSLKLSMLNSLNALRSYEELPVHLWMGMTLDNLAELNWLVGRTEKAIEYRKRQLALIRELDGHWVIEWQTLIKLGLYFAEGNDFNPIYPYFDQALELARRHEDTNYISFSYTNLFDVMLRQAEYDNGGRKAFEQAITMGSMAFEMNESMNLDPRTRWEAIAPARPTGPDPPGSPDSRSDSSQ